MTINQQTIAEQLGLSIGTVSMALRNSPQIAKQTRFQVHSLAEQLGYKLPVRRSNRAREGTGAIQQLSFLGRFAANNSFYGAVLVGAERECQQHRINLHFSIINEITPRIVQQSTESDALLLVGSIAEPLVTQLQQLGRPIALVDNSLPHLPIDQVLTENVGSVYRTVVWLHALGHRRIAYMCGEPDVPSFKDRLLGYRTAMSKLALPTIELPFLGLQSSDTELALERWLPEQNKHGTTALVVYNDNAAITIIQSLQDCGVRVPEDLSVVGFDDVESARIVRPNLTTCHVQREQLGALAVRLLVERAQEPERATQSVVLHTTLVERGSVHALPI